MVCCGHSVPADCHPLLQYVDLRTQYSELTTLTSQYIKFITDTLRRLEEEEVGARRHRASCILAAAQDWGCWYEAAVAPPLTLLWPLTLLHPVLVGGLWWDCDAQLW